MIASLQLIETAPLNGIKPKGLFACLLLSICLTSPPPACFNPPPPSRNCVCVEAQLSEDLLIRGCTNTNMDTGNGEQLFCQCDTFAAAQLVDTSSQCTFFRKKCHIEIGSTRYEHFVQSNEKYSDVTNRPSARASSYSFARVMRLITSL